MKTILCWPGMCCALLMEQEADESMTALQVWTNTNGNASKQEDSPAEKHKSNTKRNIGGQDEVEIFKDLAIWGPRAVMDQPGEV